MSTLLSKPFGKPFGKAVGKPSGKPFAKPLPTGSFLMLLLFLAVLVSAIAVAYSAHLNRTLLNGLYTELSERDKAQAEWGRLILEQSTWTAHSRIEALATEQLKMHVPDAADVRMVAP